MAWTTADIPNLRGRVAVVTGANAGLGLATARELARAGGQVVLAARNLAKAGQAVAEIRGEIPDAEVTVTELDLASLASVRAAAEEITGQHDHIDILVNNAGVMGISEQQTDDGFEMQLGVNHLGHFALTSLLLPTLRRAEASRVVSVTSFAHHFGRSIDPANPHMHGNYEPWAAYNQSKLANYHFAIGLHRMFTDAMARCASLLAHPGLSNTNLLTNSVTASGGGRSQQFWQLMAQRTGMSAPQGALPQLRAGTDPAAKSGQFYAPRYFSFGPPERRPILRRRGLDDAIKRLWAVSEEATGLTIRMA